MTTVVCLKRSKEKVLVDCDVYIGRKLTMGGWDMKESEWANPFKGPRAVYEYYKWIHEDDQKELREKGKRKLKNKVLGCWCMGKKDKFSCHGEVWIYICDGVMPDMLTEVVANEEKTLKKVEKYKEKFLSKLGNIQPLSREDRIIGMFTAAFMGDALGAKFEFAGKKREQFKPKMKKGFTFFSKRTKESRTYAPGQVTDDSEMMIMLATNLINNEGEIEAESLVEEYIKWAHSGQSFMGKNTVDLFAGITTLKGYSSHYEKKFEFKPRFNKEPKYKSDPADNQLSNGCLMRSAPLALLKDNSLVYRDVYISNPNSICLEIEKDYLTAIRMALDGSSASEILDFFFRDEKHKRPYRKVLEDLKASKKRTLTNTKTEGKGSIMSAIYATIWCLMWYVNGIKPTDDEKSTRRSPSYLELVEGLIEEFPGCDSDTNCCIMSALIGAIIGNVSLSSDKNYLYNFSKIYDYTLQTDRPRPLEYHPSIMFKLYPKLFKL